MAVFITGLSQMNWGQVADLPPHWNVDSQQWANSRRNPARGSTMAEPIDLRDFWPGRKKPDWEEEKMGRRKCQQMAMQMGE